MTNSTYNQLTITTTGQAIRAALHASGKTDVRYYLNGICLSQEHNAIVSTTGNYLFKTDVEYLTKTEDKENFILENFKVPATVTKVVIRIQNGQDIADVEMWDKKGNNVSMLRVNVINGTFPNWMRVMPQRAQEQLPKEVGFNATFLALAEKIYGKNKPVKLSFFDDMGKTTIEPAKDNVLNQVLVLMPLNLDRV